MVQRPRHGIRRIEHRTINTKHKIWSHRHLRPDLITHEHQNSKLLKAFAAQRVHRRLTRLHPAAGQLPLPGHRRRISPLLGKEPTIPNDGRPHHDPRHTDNCLHRTWNRAPPSGDSPTRTVPPRRRTTSATNAKPSPDPPLLRARSSWIR